MVVTTYCPTIRHHATDTNTVFGVVGKDYQIVQTKTPSLFSMLL